MKRTILRTIAFVLTLCLLLSVSNAPIHAAGTPVAVANPPTMTLESLPAQIVTEPSQSHSAEPPAVPQAAPGVNRYSVLLLDVEGGFTMNYNGVEIYKVQTPLETVKQAALKFVEQVQTANGTNHVAVITYDSSASIISGFSTDMNELTGVINRIQTGSGFANINDALEQADALLSQITDENAIKNVVLFSQGVTGAGNYTDDGPYTVEDCSWIITATDIYIYQHSNAAYNTAQAMMEKYNLYSVGLFQEFDQVPEDGLTLLTFAKQFAGSLQNKGFYDVVSVDDLIFAFGDIAEEIGVQEVPFKFSGHLVKDDVESVCYYSDGYFLQDASIYNDHLATMSLCFELTTWSRFDDTAKWTTDETVKNAKFSNARDLLVDQLGFTGFTVNEFWAAEPTTDSIGAVAAHKELPDGSTLVALGVRGGGYGKEWASNFTLGPVGEHDGFALARDNVLGFLDQFLVDQNITGPIKLWIVGYSRAGATANMVAGELNKGWELSSGATIAHKDLFAYTFEGAQGALKSLATTVSHDNIHNVVNINDVVPMVAPTCWNFVRYNTDEWLPSTYSAGYESQKSIMKRIYDTFREKIPDSDTRTKEQYHILDYGGNYSIEVDPLKFLPGGDPLFRIERTPSDVPTQTVMLDSLGFLFDDVIQSRTFYYEDFEDCVREIFALLNSDVEMDKFWEEFKSKFTVDAILDIIAPAYALNFDSDETRKEKVMNNLEDFLAKSLREMDLPDSANVADDLARVLGQLLSQLFEAILDDALSNNTASLMNTVDLVYMAMNGGVGQAHYPEITLSWLMSQDSFYVDTAKGSDPRSYRVIRINCPIDVMVYNTTTGVLEASFIQDAPHNPDGTDAHAYLSRDGEKTIILPASADYRVEMTATGNGSVSYTIDEFSMDRMDTARIVCFDSIAVSTDDLLVGIVPAFSEAELEASLPNGSSTEYTLLDQNNTPLAPDSEVTGADAAEASYRVTVQANSQNGYVTGGGIYSLGSFAQVSAYPLAGSTFLGWYVDDTCVSLVPEYRFSVRQDMVLSARFTEVEKHQITFASDEGGSVSNVPICVPAQSQIILEAAATPGYEFSHWTVSGAGTFDNTLDPNATFTVSNEAVITAHWRRVPEHVCPSEHFVDVSEENWWHEATDYVVEKGYMNGMSTTYFGPAVTMNRAQFVTVLYRMEGEPIVENTGIFRDVPENVFYTDAVYWALNNGITTGTTQTTFSPNGMLTRTELVTFMYRYAVLKGYDTSAAEEFAGYTDAGEILSFAITPWKWAVRHGIVSGMTSTTLAPMSLTNRAQAATIFQRFDNTMVVRSITWTEINAESTYDSAQKLTGFLLQGMFTCEPHSEEGFTAENSFGAEVAHKPFYVDSYAEKYMYFSFRIPNDPSMEGRHTVTLYYDGTSSTAAFYLDYIGDYTHLIGTSGSTAGLGWKVTGWKVVE